MAAAGNVLGKQPQGTANGTKPTPDERTRTVNGHTQEALDATARTWAEVMAEEAAAQAALEAMYPEPEPAQAQINERIIDDGNGVMWLHKPDANCPHCHGSGEVERVDWVPMPFGPGNCAMTTIEDCDCGEWLELGPATED